MPPLVGDDLLLTSLEWFGGFNEALLYDDPLGGLQQRLWVIDPRALPPMPQCMQGLASARRIRNDVMHAFLVRDGLFRRTASGGYEEAFYTVAPLARARGQIEAASSLGNQMLSARLTGVRASSPAWGCLPRVVCPDAGEW